ncbi:MAG: hypothetical protein Q4E69_05425 [Bacilli bacterium]|nr:hypothetical protein [Bacilli bacterium]
MKKKNKSLIYTLIALLIIIIIAVPCIKYITKNNVKKHHFSSSNNITIRYAYGLGVTTVEQRNSKEPYLDIVTITPTKEELKGLKKAINNNTFILDKNIESTGVAGEYELTIGDEVVFFDQEEGIYTKDNKNFYKIDITTELFDAVSDIVFNNVNKKQEQIKTNTLSISNKEIGQATFTDKNEVKEIVDAFRYVKLKSNTEALIDTDYIIDFNNGITITTYMNTNEAVYTNTNTGEASFIYLYTNPTETLKNHLEEKITLDEGLKSSQEF